MRFGALASSLGIGSVKAKKEENPDSFAKSLYLSIFDVKITDKLLHCENRSWLEPNTARLGGANNGSLL